jgi:hypothetical protein
MRVTRRLLPIAVTALVAWSAAADESEPARYGVVQSAQPTEVSGGFLGLGKEPGVTYTIRLLHEADPILVTSANRSFLTGDCVTVSGKGNDTSLMRAADTQCGEATSGSAAAKKPAASGAGHGASATGPESEACRRARLDVEGLEPGTLRRRALLHEFSACAEPLAADCQKAWDAVTALPFGPSRGRARAHAQEVCAATAR